MSNNTLTSSANVKNGFQIPKWAGKPPNGLHLDVMKEGKMIQKLMIDENKCYFFGRNKDQCEFVIDHASCSRVHAVLLWHKHLNRSFLIDLDSTHGTFIGSIRLDPNKPQQVFFDSELKFGASTRTYIVRERPQLNKHSSTALQSNLGNNSNLNNSLNDSLNKEDDSINMSNIAALPESEAELDNLTEFNTAHNKRIAQLVDLNSSTKSIPSITGLLGPVLVKKKKKMVSFNDEEDVINPEDVDPTVGRFRNMIQTTIVIPNKKKRMNSLQFQQQLNEIKKVKLTGDEIILKEDKNEEEEEVEEEEDQTLYDNDEFEPNYGSIGIKTLNLAPDVDNYTSSTIASEQLLQKYQQSELHNKQQLQQQQYHQEEDPSSASDLSKKKIYAKESWPGHKKQANAEAQQATSQVATITNTKPSPIQSANNTPNKTTPAKPAASSPPSSTTNTGATTSSVAPKRLII